MSEVTLAGDLVSPKFSYPELRGEIQVNSPSPAKESNTLQMINLTMYVVDSGSKGTSTKLATSTALPNTTVGLVLPTMNQSQKTLKNNSTRTLYDFRERCSFWTSIFQTNKEDKEWGEQ